MKFWGRIDTRVTVIMHRFYNLYPINRDSTERENFLSLVVVIVLAVVFFLLSTGCQPKNTNPVLLSIDPNARYQTIEGWEATLSGIGIPFDEWTKNPTAENYDKLNIKDPVPDALRSSIMDAAVFELGLNQFRLGVGPQVEMRNDNDDHTEINYKAFRFKWQDFLIKNWLLPLKKRIEQRGDPMVLCISYDLRSKLTPAWLLQPEEYAEMAVATLTHLKRTYNLEPAYWSVLNEPGNNRPGNPKLVAQLIARTGQRIKKAGFATRMSGPEVVTPTQITTCMKALNATPGALAQLGQLTYHLYWDPWNIVQRNEIRNWAHKLDITTAQTEWWEGKGLEVVEALYLDLTEANVSAWEQYGLCWTVNRANKGGGGDYFVIQRDFSSYRMNNNSWYLRQVMNFIRPGDIRIGISSPNPKIKPMAFLKPDGRQTIVVINSSSHLLALRIKNLAPGTYHVVLTNQTYKGKVLPHKGIAAGQAFTFQMPAKTIVTFHGTKASELTAETCEIAQRDNKK